MLAPQNRVSGTVIHKDDKTYAESIKKRHSRWGG